jgi:hypothetical protein
MKSMRRFLAALLVVCIAGAGVPLPASAAVVATDAVTAAAERDRVNAMLAREDVRAKLAQDIDALPAGGDGIIGAIVLVILLITDILGWTKVFPFTRAQR